MVIGILKEPESERRVAFIPEHIKNLSKLKINLFVQNDCGALSFFSDMDYKEAGAEVVDRDTIIDKSEIIIRIQPFSKAELEQMPNNKILLSIFNPLVEKENMKFAATKGLVCLSLDMIPRSSRGQAMDILSSMATIAGYKAVLEAANRLPKFFPMFMSAAGTIRPAKMLILGAGVAGLQAIAVGRKLGAVVEVFDVRAAVKEEVMSLGGKFIEVEGAKDDKAAGGYAVEQSEDFKKKQRLLIHEHASKANVIITTAQIPGRIAPILITKQTVEEMQAGSVIIDLAASTGGNCEVTVNEKTIEFNKVTIVGNSNLPAEMPTDASRMFGNNIINLLKILVDEEGNLKLDFEDEIVKGITITNNNEVVNERVLQYYQTQ